jgi:aryl-alcohol dehydrogenase-like predicted oxidoreductase
MSSATLRDTTPIAAPALRQRPLGRTGLTVSELGLGGLYTSSLAGGVGESIRLLQRARDLGVNYLDTAPAYADSEATLGPALAAVEFPTQAPLVISTKLGGRPQPFDPQDADALRWSFDESLRLLGRESVDILMIHEPDRPQQYDWWSDPDRCYGPVRQVLDELKASGRVRAVGLAGTTATEMARLVEQGGFDVLLTAFNYNCLFREAENELIPLARQQGMGIVLGSVLGQGGLARRFDDEVRRRPVWMSRARQRQLLDWYRLLDKTGMTPVEMGLRFAISRADISTVLIGPKTADQLEASTRLIAIGPLPADVLAALDAIAAQVPYRPFEEPMILPLGKAYFGPGMPNLGAAVKVGKLKL